MTKQIERLVNLPVDTDPLLSAKQVSMIVGVSPQTIWRRVKLGEFPLPLHAGERSHLWPLSEITAWIDALPRYPSTTTRG